MKVLIVIALGAIVACTSAAFLPDATYDGLIQAEDGEISEYGTSKSSPISGDRSGPLHPARSGSEPPPIAAPHPPTSVTPAAEYSRKIRGGSNSPQASLLPVNLEDVDTDGGLPTGSDLSPIRHARVTCDLLSFSTPWGGVNHAACAARCIAQRKKGGSCRDGVCHCRG